MGGGSCILLSLLSSAKGQLPSNRKIIADGHASRIYVGAFLLAYYRKCRPSRKRANSTSRRSGYNLHRPQRRASRGSGSVARHTVVDVIARVLCPMPRVEGLYQFQPYCFALTFVTMFHAYAFAPSARYCPPSLSAKTHQTVVTSDRRSRSRTR